MIQFALRNLKLYFRDRTSVFFSLLAVFIIIGLYVLFLGDAWTSSLEGVEGGRMMMDSWMMAGLLAVVSLTTTMGAFETMVNDRSSGIVKDFYSAPVPRTSLAAGYLISAFIIGSAMSLVALALVEAYILANGGQLLGFEPLLKVLGILALSNLTNTALVFVFISFVSTQSAFGTLSTIVGTLVGFLTGIYMPIGMMPPAVQTVIKLFPPSHAAVLMRQVMMEAPMATSFRGAPVEVLRDFKESMGVVLYIDGEPLATGWSLAYLAIAATIFSATTAIIISRRRKH